MEDKEFEKEMKQAQENRERERLMHELDFDDQKRLMLEINAKLASINSKLTFFVVISVISIIASVLLPLFLS